MHVCVGREHRGCSARLTSPPRSAAALFFFACLPSLQSSSRSARTDEAGLAHEDAKQVRGARQQRAKNKDGVKGVGVGGKRKGKFEGCESETSMTREKKKRV